MAHVETVAGSVIARSAATSVAAPLDVLLNALGQVTGCRHVVCGSEEDGEGSTRIPEVDGGLKMAYDQTLIRILDRIDSLVETPKFWKPKQRAAEKATQADLAARMTKLSLGAKLARPSQKLFDQLQMHVDEHGVCTIALAIPGGAVVGSGKTFGAALADFDSKFENSPPLLEAPVTVEGIAQ